MTNSGFGASTQPSSNGDCLDNVIQFVTEYSVRTEELIRRHDEQMSAHEERLLRLEETQAGIQRILDRLIGGEDR